MAEQSGFELLTPISPFHRRIVRECGEIFGSRKKQLCCRESRRLKFASGLLSLPCFYQAFI
jgi:hypothetical protein